MIKKIKNRIKQLEAQVAEYEEMYGGEDWEDFNASDASGGNYDDAYVLGYEHSETYTELYILRKILEELEEYNVR